MGTLKAGHLKFQFSQFAWTHMALFLIVVQAHFIMNNVLEGMIWFFLPAALVITNDIFAYICGITFGRTQLIKLSPKKTVEGFVGAWVMTVISGVVLTNLLLRSKYFICPATNLGANIFTGLECDPNPVFIPRTYSTPELFFLPPNYTLSVTMAPMQIHAFFWASFASLIAPFGGFFASGLKRTFKIKDFGDSIPGHGGMTDRMDCQFIMGLFAYIYYHTFIAFKRSSVSHVMELAIMELTTDEQLEVVKGVLKYLTNQGIVRSDVSFRCIFLSSRSRAAFGAHSRSDKRLFNRRLPLLKSCWRPASKYELDRDGSWAPRAVCRMAGTRFAGHHSGLRLQHGPFSPPPFFFSDSVRVIYVMSFHLVSQQL